MSSEEEASVSRSESNLEDNVSSNDNNLVNLTEVKEKKKRRKQAPREPYVERIIVEFPIGQGVLPVIGYLDTNYNFSQLKFEVREVKIKKNAEEKAEQRREYRKIYYSDPENAEKAKKKLQETEAVLKRKAYAELPKTKERKKLLAQRNRKLTKELKEKEPIVYKTILTSVIEKEVSEGKEPDVPRKKKRKMLTETEEEKFRRELKEENVQLQIL